MKIVVIGGTGLIGSKTVAILHEEGHEVVAGSPKSGVNTVRISFWPSPLSPTAFRAALMRLVKVDSDTIRPSQTEVIRSSITGKGLKEAVAGVQVASDLANSPSFEDKAV